MEIDRAYFPARPNCGGGTGPITKVIQKDGSTTLTEVANHYYLYGSRGSGPALKYKGADVTAGEFGKWTPIGAVKRRAAMTLPGRIPVAASTRCGVPTITATTKEI